MSDFILEYEDLEVIARYSKVLGREAMEYSEDLENTIINNINNVTGDSSGYLIQAADYVNDKIKALRQKSEAFYHFSDEITNLLVVADRMDQEVADAIAGQGEYSLEHQKANRLEDWWVKLLDLLADANKTILLMCIASLAKLKMKFESLKNSIKDWYEREYVKILEVSNQIKLLNDYIKMAQGAGNYLLNFTAAQLLKYIGTNISGLNNSTKDDNVNLLDIIKEFYNPLMDINDFMVGVAVAVDNNVFGGLLQALGGAAEPFQLDGKAFNLGKTVTDFTLMVAGAGAFIFGAAGGAGGVALDATGVGAIAGVPLTAAGLATMSIGGGIALKSTQNLVSDGLNLMSGDGHGSSEGSGAGVKSSLKTTEVTPPGSSHPVKVYTDGNAQINTGKIDTYMRGKVELDVDAVKSRINELKNIKKTNPENFNKNMKSELKSCEDKLHNYQRSQEMSKTLNNAGILDNAENNQMIAEELLEAAKSAKTGNTEIISYIEGSNGKIQVVSRWKILDDGTPYLATVILKPIK